MTGVSNDPAAGPAGEARLQMRLRPGRTPVTRLSRKVIIALVMVLALAIAVALFLALRSGRQTANSELYGIDNRATPDGLSNLPRDYAGLPKPVPKLGPPLPGDLGRPILNAGAGPAIPTAPDAEKQKVAQEQEAARVSRLFASTSLKQNTPVATAATNEPAPPGDTGAGNVTSQDRKLAFLNGNTDRRTVSGERVSAPASPCVLQAGAVIPAALLTGLRSDLPGQVTAQVTEDVYDSPTGRIRLIPQGARLIGQYDAQIAFGQSRALLVWNRLIMPNGRSIVLERQPGTDAEGNAGLEDEVDNHWGTLFKAAILSTLLSVGSEVGNTGTEDELIQGIRRGGSDSANQVGQRIVGRSLNVQPTITIRPGFPVRVLVTHDLVLEPYRG
ncbi:TrbI/VirB10 family protein [Reyranella sp.]|uniref:TrbI/VirB10 family protein n=1 Tax=Reyranella sp. TaxID=1929291 RepID=UPI003D0BC896